MISYISPDKKRLATREISVLDLKSLKKKAMRARIWRKLDTGHRAAIRVVEWVLEKGDAETVNRVSRSCRVLEMVSRATRKLLNILRSLPQILSFTTRAIIEGARIGADKARVYRERGVFSWCPWLKQWLADRETLLYFGYISLGWR